MKKLIITLIFLFLNIFGFAQEKIENSKNLKTNIEKESKDINSFKFVTSLWTAHINDNDIYNNKTNLLALEYGNQKYSISGGYFKNSFYKDSYAISLNRYFRPFSEKRIYFITSVGLVKGYYEYNYIIDSSTGKVLKKARIPTHIKDDFMIGGNIGLGYKITDDISISLLYLGAFTSFLSIRL